MTKEEIMIDELSKMPPMVISTAYLHAINYTRYGEDVTKAWVTATQQACALEKAYNKGYYDALQEHVASQETVTEFADRCKECGARYGKLLKQKSDKWIPVSEPPKTDGRYLTYIVNGIFSYMMVCDYIQQTWCPDDDTVSNNVTYWMPLPVEPYEGESEEKQ